MSKSTVSLDKLFLVLFFCFPLVHFGQNSLGNQSPDDLVYFEKYQKGLYHEVIQSLNRENTPNANQEILLLLSHQKIGNSKEEEIDSWITDHKDHPFESLATFHLAQIKFYEGDTLASKKYLSKINSSELSEENQATYSFLRGIISLNEENYKSAQKFFQKAQQKGFGEESQLIYYQAFTNYHLSEYSTALKGFEEVKDDPTYSLTAMYFIAKIYLETEEYDKAISLAQQELSEEATVTNSGLYQLIGEAYAKQELVDKADAFFDKAIAIHPGRPTAELYYQAGVSKFKVGNEDKALTYLTEAGIGKGSYAKLSAFQLGRLHIRRNEPEKALTAYMEASASEDSEIKEESIFQSVQLNAKLERYPEAINYSQDYLEKYPDGKWAKDIEELLANTYLKTSAYDKAITQLERIGLNNDAQKEVYQKVTYQQALLKFNDGQFDEAIPLFQKSLKHPLDVDLRNEAWFYLGEIYSQKGKYREALNSYNQMNPISSEGHYAIGYLYYNKREYSQAIPHFSSALTSQSVDLQQDAHLRLADCYYTTKSYENAMEQYQQLPQVDYVLFQQAMISRNLDQNDEAIRLLRTILSTSSYRDNALFYLGQIPFENAAFSEAEAGFSGMLVRYSDSPYAPKAYLNRGIARNNLGKYNEAKEDYSYVIDNFLHKEEAFSAILGLQDLAQKGVDIDNLEKYISDYKKANPGDGSLEVVEFEAAKGAYFDLNYRLAAEKLKAFLQEYPTSKYRIEVIYYLGESYYRNNEFEASRKVFDDQRFVRNEYTGRILNRLGNINWALEDYEKAIEDFELLLQMNLTQKDNYNARNGVMMASFESEDYTKTVQYATEIIESDWKPLNAEQSARLLKAKSLLKLDKLEESKQEFTLLAKGEDQIAAEASYNVAVMAYDQGDYDTSQDLLFELNARLGSYTNWVEKSYLLIADNYVAKDELFQAKATLRSIIQHSQSDETKAVAMEKLEAIEQDAELDTLTEGN